MKRIYILLVALCAALLLTPLAIGGPGHDHGDAAPTVVGSALPRFTAQSDLFDAVGVLGRDELVVFIDRAATNEPVLNAIVELESGSVKAIGKFEATLGEYHFDGKPFQQTAVHPITLTIKAGNDTDLLSADLDVHGEEPVAKVPSALPHTFREYPVWVGAGLLAIILLVGGFIWSFKRTSVVGRRDRSAA